MNRFRFSLATLLVAVVAIAVACAALRYASEVWASAAFSVTLLLLLGGVLGVVFRCGERRVFWSGFALFGWAYLLFVFGAWFNTNVKNHLVTTKMLTYLHTRMSPVAWLTGVPLGTGVNLVDSDADGALDIYVANGTTQHFLFSNTADTEKTLAVNRENGLVAGDLDNDGWVELYASNSKAAPNAMYRNAGNGQFVNVTAAAFVSAQPPFEHFERVGHSVLALLIALLAGLSARYVFGRRSLSDGACAQDR